MLRIRLGAEVSRAQFASCEAEVKREKQVGDPNRISDQGVVCQVYRIVHEGNTAGCTWRPRRVTLVSPELCPRFSSCFVNHLIPICSKITCSVPQKKNQDTSDYLLAMEYFPVYLCMPAIELFFDGGRCEASKLETEILCHGKACSWLSSSGPSSSSVMSLSGLSSCRCCHSKLYCVPDAGLSFVRV